MAAVEKIIDSLEKQRIKEAVEGLARPITKDAYELGRLAGIQHGLSIAKNIVNEVIGDDEDSKKPAVRK